MNHPNYFLRYYGLPRPLMLLLIVSGVLSLCSMTSSKEIMTPEIRTEAVEFHPIPFELTVRGASAGIQPEYFEKSIVDAILSTELLTGLYESQGKPYVLDIRIVKVEAPSFSYKMTVDMNVVWELSRTDDGSQILHEKIQSTYTGGAFEGGLIGANRVRVAAEGAARENIRLGLAKLTSLDLK
jgi:hypothetical protein